MFLSNDDVSNTTDRTKEVIANWFILTVYESLMN